MWWLVSSIFVCGVLLELSARLWERVHPQSYFSVSQLFAFYDSHVSLRTVLFRMLLPVLFGFLAALVNPDSRQLSGFFTGLLGSLLLIYPALTFPYGLPQFAWTSAGRSVLVLFGLAYCLMGLGGAVFADILLNTASESEAMVSVRDWLGATEFPSSTNVLAGLVAGGALGLGTTLVVAARHLVRLLSDGRRGS